MPDSFAIVTVMFRNPPVTALGRKSGPTSQLRLRACTHLRDTSFCLRSWLSRCSTTGAGPRRPCVLCSTPSSPSHCPVRLAGKAPEEALEPASEVRTQGRGKRIAIRCRSPGHRARVRVTPRGGRRGVQRHAREAGSLPSAVGGRTRGCLCGPPLLLSGPRLLRPLCIFVSGTRQEGRTWRGRRQVAVRSCAAARSRPPQLLSNLLSVLRFASRCADADPNIYAIQTFTDQHGYTC